MIQTVLDEMVAMGVTSSKLPARIEMHAPTPMRAIAYLSAR
jgi:hypothetical protein